MSRFECRSSLDPDPKVCFEGHQFGRYNSGLVVSYYIWPVNEVGLLYKDNIKEK